MVYHIYRRDVFVYIDGFRHGSKKSITCPYNSGPAPINIYESTPSEVRLRGSCFDGGVVRWYIVPSNDTANEHDYSPSEVRVRGCGAIVVSTGAVTAVVGWNIINTGVMSDVDNCFLYTPCGCLHNSAALEVLA